MATFKAKRRNVLKLRPWGFERLEDRRVLNGIHVFGGFVTVKKDGDNASIVGDNSDNKFRVEIAFAPQNNHNTLNIINGNGRSDGENFRACVLVTGLDGTLLKDKHGQIKTSIEIFITNDVNINTKNGGDSVEITRKAVHWLTNQALPRFECPEFDGYDAPEDINCDTGDGDDEVVLHDLAVADDISIKTGKGEDCVVLQNVYLKDNLEIKTDDDDDHVDLLAVTAEDPDDDEEDGEIKVETGRGNDVVRFEAVCVEKDLKIDSGDGVQRRPDDFNMLLENGDNIGLRRVEVGENVEIKTGSGADSVALDEVEIDEDLTIKTNGGAFDDIALRALDVDGDVKIETGSGSDRVTTIGVTADEFKANGGSGFDTFVGEGTIVADKKEIRSFEDRIFKNDPLNDPGLFAFDFFFGLLDADIALECDTPFGNGGHFMI